MAVIQYYYHGEYVGTATVDLAQDIPAPYKFSEKAAETMSAAEPNVIIVNIKLILFIVLAIAALLIVAFTIRSVARSYNFRGSSVTVSRRGREAKKKPERWPSFFILPV